MRYIQYLLLLLLFPITAHAQSCTPNNNNSFSINGNTLSGSGLAAGTYTAGIIVNMSGVGNSGTCFPVTVTGQTSGGGGGPTLVQATSSNPFDYWIYGTGSCTWTLSQAIASGDLVVGFGHFSNLADNAREYPTSVTDNAGNTYTLRAGIQWLPYPEDIGMWYLQGVLGNPTSLTFHFADTGIGYSCNVGFAEYSNATINATVGPITNASSPDPSITVSPTATSLIWAFGAPNPISSCLNSGQQGSIETAGYTLLIDNCRYDGVGLWGSNSTVSAGPQTIAWNNHDYWNASVCADGSNTTTGCSTLMMAAAISGGGGGGGGGGGPTITVNGSGSGTTVIAGSSMAVAVTGGPAYPADWIALCNTSTPSHNNCTGLGYAWVYVQDCSHTLPSSGATSGSCSMLAPGSAGSYQAVFLSNDSYNVLASAPFTVTGGGGGGSACTSSVGGPSPPPCPNGVAAPAGYHWDVVFYDNFTEDSYADGNRWYISDPSSIWCCDSSLGLASTPAWGVLSDLYSKYQRQFGYWEVAFQAPNDASGGSDGRHEDINFNVGQGSCRAELDFFEKTIGQNNPTSALGSYTDDPSNSCNYVGGFYNTPDGSCFCSHSHTIGLNWANDGSSYGTISGYIDGQQFIGPHTLVVPNWLYGAGMGIDLFDKACAVDGSVGFGGGGTCHQATFNTSGDPFWYQHARIWRLAPN